MNYKSKILQKTLSEYWDHLDFSWFFQFPGPNHTANPGRSTLAEHQCWPMKNVFSYYRPITQNPVRQSGLKKELIEWISLPGKKKPSNWHSQPHRRCQFHPPAQLLHRSPSSPFANIFSCRWIAEFSELWWFKAGSSWKNKSTLARTSWPGPTNSKSFQSRQVQCVDKTWTPPSSPLARPLPLT